MNKRNTFRSMPLRQQTGIGVDMNTRTISGVAVMQVGQLNDSRPWHVDETSVQQIVDFGNRPNKGLKSRFTHPNMSDDGMGKMLGRLTNFRVDGATARADLAISPRADSSPVGEIGTYVLELARDEPDLFGMSVVIEFSEDMNDSESDSYSFDEDRQTTALRISNLYAVDVVDEPAATRGGLFDANGLADLPAMVTRVLDTHFPDAKPQDIADRFSGFMRRYFDDQTITFDFSEDTNMAEDTRSAEEELQAQEDEVLETDDIIETCSYEFGSLMLEKYGNVGLRMAWEGKSEIEIIEHFRSHDKEEIEQLKQQLEASQEFTGETDGLSSSEPIKMSEELRLAEQYKNKPVASPSMAALIAHRNKVSSRNP